MRDADIHSEVEIVLRRNLPALPAEEVIPTEARLADLGLDSIGVISLLLDLEESLGISIPFELLTVETFQTRGSLEAAVQTLAVASSPA